MFPILNYHFQLVDLLSYIWGSVQAEIEKIKRINAENFRARNEMHAEQRPPTKEQIAAGAVIEKRMDLEDDED